MDVEKTIEFLREQGAATDARLQKLAEDQAALGKKMDKLADNVAQTNAVLRRAIRFSVESIAGSACDGRKWNSG